MEIPASGKMTVGKSVTYTLLLKPKACCMKRRPPFSMKTMWKSVSNSRRLLNKFHFFIVIMVMKQYIPRKPWSPEGCNRDSWAPELEGHSQVIAQERSRMMGLQMRCWGEVWWAGGESVNIPCCSCDSGHITTEEADAVSPLNDLSDLVDHISHIRVVFW